MCRHITCNATKLPQLYKLYSCYCLKVYVSLPCFSFLHLGSSAARRICRNSVIFQKKNSWKNILLRLGKICKTISTQDFQLPHGCIFFWLSLMSFGSPWVLVRWKTQVFAVILVCYAALHVIKICIKYGRECCFTITTFHPYMPTYVHKTFFAQSLNDAYWDIFFRVGGKKRSLSYSQQNKFKWMKLSDNPATVWQKWHQRNWHSLQGTLLPPHWDATWGSEEHPPHRVI